MQYLGGMLANLAGITVVESEVSLLCQRWSGEPGRPVWGSVHWTDSRSWFRCHCSWAAAHKPPTLYPEKLRWVFQSYWCFTCSKSGRLSQKAFSVVSGLHLPLLNSLPPQWFFPILRVPPIPPVTPCRPWQPTTSSLAFSRSRWSKNSNCNEESSSTLTTGWTLDHQIKSSTTVYIYIVNICYEWMPEIWEHL